MMHRIRARAWTKRALACALTLASISAWAYIPPTAFILKSVVAKHSGLAGIQVTSAVSGFDSVGKPSGLHFKSVSFYDANDGSVVGTALDPLSGRKLYQIERHAPSLSLPATILWSTNAVTLKKALKARGLIFGEETVSPSNAASAALAPGEMLGRFKQQVAWVLGEGKEKFWIEKDSFLPLRFVTDKGAETRFENYRFYKEFPYPRLITLFNAPDVPSIQDETTDVVVYTEESRVASKKPKLAADGSSAGGPGLTAEGNAAPAELQALIKQYYEALR